MKLFKGYITSNGKKPTVPKVTSEFWTEEPPTTGDYMGILKHNIIQVDFDDADMVELALKIVKDKKLKCDVLQTERGVHLYFLNDNVNVNDSHLICAMGLTYDIGSALHNKTRSIPLRVTKTVKGTKTINGEEIETTETKTHQREWLQQYDELEVIPCYLKPVCKFVGSDFRNCDNRNSTLWRYILHLQKEMFNLNDVRKIVKMINSYMFTTPLDDKEIDTICRKDAFSEEIFFSKKGAFLHNVFGDYLLTNANIVRIDGEIHIYNRNGLYCSAEQDFKWVITDKIPSLKDSQKEEVYKHMKIKCDRKEQFMDARYIGLKNGILDIETMEEFPYSPNWIITNRIEYGYDESVYSKTMDDMLNSVSCNNKDVRALLEEIIGYSLYRANTMQTCFILTGEGSNGKSTFLDTVKRLLGKANYTSLSLQDLETQFKPVEMLNKLANLGDDISAKYLETSSIFKKVVTGESFSVERKYGQPFELESYATQIFCANELPNVKDKTDGFNRRITLVPFKAKYGNTKKDYNPNIARNLKSDEAMTYLLKLAIAGLKRVLKNNKFTKSDVGEAEKNEYVKSNNPILEWLDEEPSIENESLADVYLVYGQWCMANGHRDVSTTNLKKELRRLGYVDKVKKIDKKAIRIFIKKEITEDAN